MISLSLKDDPILVDQYLYKAQQAFKNGKTKQLKFRVKQLEQLKKGLTEMKKELSDGIKQDLGRDHFATWFYELAILEYEIEHTLKNLEQWASDHTVPTPTLLGPGDSKVIYEPLGVVCVMGSWNYPVYTVLAPLIHVISAGNCCIIKPSEMAPNSFFKVRNLVEKYLDNDCYYCIEGQIEVAKRLCASKFDSICFTGSTEKGKLVAAAAAQNLVPCLLELGGKCPVLVDKSADVDLAAKKIIFGKYLNAGQTCVAPDYTLVHESIKDQFIKISKKYMKDFWAEGKNIADFGKIINDHHKKRVCDLMQDHKGQVIVGNPNAHKDQNLTPTIVLNPSLDSKLMKEEIFGPVMPLITFNNFDDALRIVNNLDKPLVVYYFGSPYDKNLKRLEKETSSGMVVANETMFQMLNPELPFGGVGMSGYGRYHGFEGFKSFSNTKSVLIKQSINAFPYNYAVPPFTPFKQKAITKLQKLKALDKSAILKKAFQVPYLYAAKL